MKLQLKLFFIALLFFSEFGFSQNFRYEFKVNGITDNANAKNEIEVIRDLLGVQSILFDEAIDHFIIITHLDFDIEESINKLTMNGVEIVGTISKINIE